MDALEITKSKQEAWRHLGTEIGHRSESGSVIRTIDKENRRFYSSRTRLRGLS